MQRISVSTLLILFSMLLGTAQAAIIGKATSVEGTVYLNPDDSDRTLSQDDPVQTKDIIVTGKDGRTTITLNDGSQLKIDSASRLVLAQYDLGDKPQGLFDLTRGRLRAVVTDAFAREKNSFKVRTGTAVMGVQGTDFLVYSDTILTIVQVLTGIVQVVNIDPTVGGAILLTPGQGAEIRSGKTPEPVTGNQPGAPDGLGFGSGGEQDQRSSEGSQALDGSVLTPELGGGTSGGTDLPPGPNVPEQ